MSIEQLSGTDNSRKQLLIAAAGILLNQGRQLCNVDTHTISRILREWRGCIVLRGRDFLVPL